ncbi:MAG: universal stress protein, partial [Pseudomonadota bacterium]
MDQTSAMHVWLGRILHATDFSPRGHLAFVHALKLALAARGQLSIVHVDIDGDEKNNDWNDFPDVRSTLTAWGLLPPDAPTSAVAPATGVQVVKHEIGFRNPLKGVMSLLQRHPADLVVLASRALDGRERRRSPSVAEPLARETALPTLFLPHDAAGFVDPATGAVRLGKILIPVDAAPRPEAALELAQTLVGMLGATDAEIVMLHVGAETLTVANAEGKGQRTAAAREKRDLMDAVIDGVDELSRLGSGDVLVFLPGEREIRDAAEALRKHHPPHVEILPLFARLSA